MPVADQTTPVHRTVRWGRVAVTIFLLLMSSDFVFLAVRWPFTRSAVLKSLEEAAHSTVEIASFRQVFLPFPGCIARGVTVHRQGNVGPPLITIDRMIVQDDYIRVITFSNQLRAIRTEGTHIRIQNGRRTPSPDELGANITIEQLSASNTVLEFLSATPGNAPFAITIRQIVMSPISGKEALHFDADLRIPEPPGDVHTSGRFGPWKTNDPFATPVSGEFRLQHGDLSFAVGLAGEITGAGRFTGTVRRLAVEGSARASGFAVRSIGHSMDVGAAYRATINGQNGDVALESIDARFRRSEVRASGSVAAHAANSPHRVELEISVPKGGIEDFLYLLSSSAPPGMTGGVNMRFHTVVPTGEAPFLRKLEMDGTFRIAEARFTEPQTQQSLDRISRRAAGEKHAENEGPDVCSDLQGHVSTSGGMARFASLGFEVPGASARLSGTYDLTQHDLDLHGTADLAVPLSKTQKGAKSFLLKIVGPFVEKRHGRGASAPIKITGRAGQLSLGLDVRR